MKEFRQNNTIKGYCKDTLKLIYNDIELLLRPICNKSAQM